MTETARLWVSDLASDGREECHDIFYETPLFKLLTYQIKNYPSGLTLIKGLQGSGKSRLLLELSRRFPWG